MLLQEAVLAEAYAKHFPGRPPYSTLSLAERREIRGYFESRGVIFNPRFGVTGRIGGYTALRDFTIGEADRAEVIAKRAEEQEEAEAEAEHAEEEELHRAATPRVSEPRTDPSQEIAAKQALAKLKQQYPQPTDKSPQADAARNDILDQAIELLEPYAKIVAKRQMGLHFNEYDAEEFAHDALVAWKNKVLKRVVAIQNGETDSSGAPLQDAFSGRKLHSERNLFKDIGTFVFNTMQSRGKKAANRARLAPMDPIASEHEGERGEDEPPIGHQVTTGEDPAKEITGVEREKDIFGMFRTLSRDLRRQASTEAADLLDAMLKTNSFDERELAAELGWQRKKLRNVRTVLTSYLKHRAKTHPELRRLTRVFGEAAERLCEKYAVLNLLLRSNFLPSAASKSMTRIYEKFELI